MNEEIIQKIKFFKKEEIFRTNQLKNQQISETKNNQIYKEKVLTSIDVFQDEINNLSLVYDGLNENENKLFNNFISFSYINNYELIENDLSEIMDDNLDKLNQVQREILKSDDKSDYKNLDVDYRVSLYLKYEAQLKEIEASAELASLEEAIKCITINKKEEIQFENDFGQQIKDISSEIEISLKKLFMDQSSLVMSECVESRLKCQTENVDMIEELIKLWKMRIARGKMQLSMLNDEKKTHQDLLDILSSLSNVVTTITKLEEQLKSLARRIISSTNDTFNSLDTQFLTRVKHQLTDFLEPIMTKLEHYGSIWEECNKQKQDGKELLLEIEDVIESSKLCFENIRDNFNDFNSLLKRNKTPEDRSKRPTIFNEINSMKFNNLSILSNQLKDRLKEIKDRVSKLDIE